jgi:hypothetical protein
MDPHVSASMNTTLMLFQRRVDASDMQGTCTVEHYAASASF